MAEPLPVEKKCVSQPLITSWIGSRLNRQMSLKLQPLWMLMSFRQV